MKMRSAPEHYSTVPHLLVSMYGGVCSCGLSNPPELAGIRAFAERYRTNSIWYSDRMSRIQYLNLVAKQMSGKRQKDLKGSSNNSKVVNKK